MPARFVRGQHSGVLSTLSQRVEGFPFGSVAPFMLDHTGCPVILISTLAEHTKNIAADPRVSLIVQPYSPDMQVAGRVTVLGRAQRLEDKSALGRAICASIRRRKPISPCTISAFIASSRCAFDTSAASAASTGWSRKSICCRPVHWQSRKSDILAHMNTITRTTCGLLPPCAWP
jgi:hypothetical protein